jgi:hypothetical protein
MCVELQNAVILLVMRPCCDTIYEHCTLMRLHIGGYLYPLLATLTLHILARFWILCEADCFGSLGE